MSATEKNLSLDEKLAIIEGEIRLLHKFCLDKGYTPTEIEYKARPILQSFDQKRRKKIAVVGAEVFLVCLVLSSLCYFDPFYRMLLYAGRTATIKVLPLWDWSELYSQQCLVSNPYYDVPQLTLADCETCENLEEVQHVSNISQIVMAENFIKRDIPVVITDATGDWSASSQFDVDFVRQLYSDDLELREALPCMFASNIRVKYSNARAIMDKAGRHEITNWYAHWENCEREAGRSLRRFYQRPYFMPAMVEMSDSNWVLIASHYKPNKYKPVDIAFPLMWYAQLQGEASVELRPHSPCNNTCPTLHTTLLPGHMLVVTDTLWSLHYMPLAVDENVALAGGGYFD